MTEKEATIKKAIQHYRYGVTHDIFSDPVTTYAKLAIQALGKQIPKKPIFVDTRFRHHGKHISDGISLSKCYKCPCCKMHIFHVWDDEEYCDRCGQKLDWKEEE